MKKILHIISSPRGNGSLSIKLGNAVIERIQESYPGSSVETYDLLEKKFPHLEEAHITSFFTPAEQRSKESLEAIKHSDEAIAAINNADIIVVGAPMYNFNIHSSLKAWVDHIVRAGVTFSYTENGAEGLIKGKKVYIAMASGGIYSEGAARSMDYVSPYLRMILGFVGMTDVSLFRVEGSAIPEQADTALEKAVNSIVID